MKPHIEEHNAVISFEDFKKKVIQDYKLAVLSRQCSILGRREVLNGKGKFGIFGDGKELPQVVLNHFFQKGDYRAGYYRDQTLLMAQGLLDSDKFFASLYGHPDLNYEPMSGGRQMGAHFMTENIDENGNWVSQKDIFNHSADLSPTASQMPRLVGLAQASKIYRNLDVKSMSNFSSNGNEIAWGTIGNASTSEGVFFEAINAAGVLQVPMIISIWDDGYGISVDNKLQTTKESISEILKGFQRDDKLNGFEILVVKGWNYSELLKTYEYASKLAREKHVPSLIHVTELTQPLGHSTSGSHERYKSKKRLEWEQKFDCNLKMKEWILANGISNEKHLNELESKIKEEVKESRIQSWKNYQKPIIKLRKELNEFAEKIPFILNNKISSQLLNNLNKKKELLYKDIISASRKINYLLYNNQDNQILLFKKWLNDLKLSFNEKYSSKLYSEGINSHTKVKEVSVTYEKDPLVADGSLILRNNFDALLKKYDRLLIFGEDTGKIGGVNQGLKGLQEKYGLDRVSDTGIRESTIIGQGIGLALRGLRPIAEIQYLDYILYCIQTLSDDLATLSYRTVGRQIAPLIIRTRGHRLEGIWHSGSPMGALTNLLRGILILVPRNMLKAAGFYNTLMKCNQPAVVVEPLNAYRLKEKMPKNLGEFCLPIGEIEIIKEGTDITIISYGSTLKIVSTVAHELKEIGINCEVIDIQTLIPFDQSKGIRKSLLKTNRLLIVDEDVPGGASSYILQELLKKQNIYNLLDSPPELLTAKEHRPPYAEDGDYFSKPSKEDIFEKIISIMHEVDPNKYPSMDI